MSGTKARGNKKSVASWRHGEASDNTCPVTVDFDTDSHVYSNTPKHHSLYLVILWSSSFDLVSCLLAIIAVEERNKRFNSTLDTFDTL